MSPNHSKVRIHEIIKPSSCSQRLLLGWKGDVIREEYMNKGVDIGDIREDDVNKGSEYDDSDNNEGNDYDDSVDLIVKDNMVEDVDVNMKDFYLNIERMLNG
ncbi:unnamed protein product [Lactuca saligna]|uniref:Uncharacterized protein n=1 Tax=Lactuca saligna TaxID=75948 RepID=A0AA35UU12_LACSI|nr:unnamed protein product [Lactuca saligna]